MSLRRDERNPHGCEITMNLFGVMDVSASALRAERVRAEVVASNMANAETTRTPDGGPYQRHHVVFESADGGSSQDSLVSQMQHETGAFGSGVKGALTSGLGGGGFSGAAGDGLTAAKGVPGGVLLAGVI